MARSAGAPGVSPSAAGLPPWKHLLQENDKGIPLPTLWNCVTIWEHEPSLVGAVSYDKFHQRLSVVGPLPWDRNVTEHRQWKEADTLEATVWFHDQYIRASDDTVYKAAQTVGDRHAFHPVMDYLGKLQWDRVRRITNWLAAYCGALNTRYVRAVSRRWMLSAVARVMEPGCQCDSMLVLEGEERIGKSSAFQVLGQPWYASDISAIGNKDAKLLLAGKWIVEISELAALRRTDWEVTKSFISCRSDWFRRPYGRAPEELPRQSVFGGTSNSSNWAPEPEGMRRFWPVLVSKIDLPGLRRDRDQLWAEAVWCLHNLRNGQRRWWLDDDAGLYSLAHREQMLRIESDDPWEGQVSGFIAYKVHTTTHDVLEHIGVKIEDMSRQDEMRISRLLRLRFGWVRARRWTLAERNDPGLRGKSPPTRYFHPDQVPPVDMDN